MIGVVKQKSKSSGEMIYYNVEMGRKITSDVQADQM
jgi:hypothetical protein